MVKIDIVPSLENEIAEIKARNEMDEAINAYRVKKVRRLSNSFFLIISLGLIYLGQRYNANALEAMGLIGSVGFGAEYVRRFIKASKELDKDYDEIYDEDHMNKLKESNDMYLKNKNYTKLITGKKERELNHMKFEENKYDNTSRLGIKKIIKRNEREYYRHYDLPENMITNPEFNSIVDSLYVYLEEFYPKINKEEFVLKLFRLLYADSLVNLKKVITCEDIMDALYYDTHLNDVSEIDDIFYLIEDNLRNKENKKRQ